MSDRPNPLKATRFVVELCQQALATSFQTLYQLHAITIHERFLRKQQAEKLIATWATCDLFLKLFPSENEEVGREQTLEFVKSLSGKVNACVEEVSEYESLEVLERCGRFESFPEAFWPLPKQETEQASNARPPLPELVVDQIVGLSEHFLLEARVSGFLRLERSNTA
ncbi:hypothetical protein HK097_002735 [Rhizophlyctis rosea]|uniref:Uncharacterized protein n=1 Tax=Rhizophlyctis rosea TaxID=64517 RepID=A0AAD5S322_9FUNG|nr:hypothetical protein HK097_002735 [Rhizophlyctis rosea]